MDRTVPTWRNRVEAELNALNAFRRALSTNDKLALDELIDGVRNRRAAGGMLPSIDAWKPMLISMLIECHGRIMRLEKQLDEMQNEK